MFLLGFLTPTIDLTITGHQSCFQLGQVRKRDSRASRRRYQRLSAEESKQLLAKFKDKIG